MSNLSKQKISLVFGGVSLERDLSLRAFHHIYTQLQEKTASIDDYSNIYYIKEDGLVIKKACDFTRDPDYYIEEQGKSLST